MNLPNALTLSRILAAPLAVFLHATGQVSAAYLTLLYAFLTDFFDGYLARRWQQTTPLGGLLDPVADKVIVVVCYGYLYHTGLAPWWLVTLLFGRNIAQLMAIPILSWWLKKPFGVKPKWQAKWATAIYFINIPLILLYADWPMMPFQLSLVRTGMIGLSAVFEIYIMVTYLPRLFQIARGTHDTFE